LEPSAASIARAARVLVLRSRREAAGAFLGSYAGAFRGGGVEFEESRPYVPGDDVRNLDWNATARTGEPYVKHFREERDQTVWLALDGSASMGFGTTERTKAAAASHVIALLAAAAGQAGDRVGLLTFDDRVRSELPPSKGPAHTRQLIEHALRSAENPSGDTRLAAACETILERASGPSVVILLSDFRDESLVGSDLEAADRAHTRPSWHAQANLAALSGLCSRHDVVSVVVGDPREESLPGVGLVRVVDLERPGRTQLIDSSSSGARERYGRAALMRRRALQRCLHRCGSDVLWLDSRRDPLQPLMYFFRERASRVQRVA